MRDAALLHVNGVRREIRGREALMMLADWLRKEAGMPGTKIVCAEGDCGACTVLRAFPVARAQQDSAAIPTLNFEAMNSCIATVAQMDGSHIVTVEGMQCGDELSPAQSAMNNCHASQCGYCTPGFVMAISAMLERPEHSAGAVDAKTAANYLTGNLCRCTGYAPIIQAAITVRATEKHSVAGRYSNATAIVDAITATQQSLRIEHDGVTFFAPVSLREACTFAAQNLGFKVLGAATDMGVQVNKGKPLPRALLSLHLVKEMYEVQETRSGMRIGARVTLAEVRRRSETRAPELARFLNLFASSQIKNVATLIGNIANASPVGDTLPFLLIAGGAIHVARRASGQGAVLKRVIPMTELYVGYKKLAIGPDEIITHVSFENTREEEMVRLYKVSQRKDLDISAVSCAFAVTLLTRRGKKGPPKIASARVAYGGVAATPIRLPDAEQALIGKLTAEKVESIAQLIAASITPLSDVRASAAYRRVTAANLFRRYGSEVLHG